MIRTVPIFLLDKNSLTQQEKSYEKKIVCIGSKNAQKRPVLILAGKNGWESGDFRTGPEEKTGADQKTK
jgi:hypothetical protein